MAGVYVRQQVKNVYPAHRRLGTRNLQRNAEVRLTGTVGCSGTACWSSSVMLVLIYYYFCRLLFVVIIIIFGTVIPSGFGCSTALKRFIRRRHQGQTGILQEGQAEDSCNVSDGSS